LKPNFLNTCQTAKTYQKVKLSKSAGTVKTEKLSITENVSSDDGNIGYNVGSYTQDGI
jgi:hypothetical protein